MYMNPTQGGGGGRGGAQPYQQQQIHPNPNFFANPDIFIQEFLHGFLPQFNSFLHNPNSFHQVQQQFPNSNFPTQLMLDNSNFQIPRPVGCDNSKFPQQHVKVPNDIDALDKAVMSARRELLASNENVSAWKVSQAALLTVKPESWETLGFRMQQVPSLNRLLVTEGKINAFIHCFVSVRKITSLYELEVAICENEGIKRFDELELGPLVRHPLAVHYFGATPDMKQVYRITTDEIISYLCDFIDSHKKKQVKVDTFLEFISKKCSVCEREKLCVRIQNFRVYINHIEHVRQSEDRILEKCYEKIRMQSVTRIKKRLLFTQKKELDDHFATISQPVKSFSSANTQFCGTHIRFTSSSSEDDESEGTECEDNKDVKSTDSNYSLSQPNLVSSCPYPSVNEEIRRLRGDKLFQRKRKFEKMSSRTSLPRKRLKKGKFDADLKHKGSKSPGKDDHSLSTKSLRMFTTTWKDTCRGNNAEQIVTPKEEHNNSSRKQPFINSNCPPAPADWKTAPGFKNLEEEADGILSEINIEVDATTISQGAVLLEDAEMKSIDNNTSFLSSNCSETDEGAQQALLTGRLGELVTFKYFMEKVKVDDDDVFVKWVNETNETGLPYDIVLGGDDESSSTREYIEVKATRFGRKNWFHITMREWEFAIEKGESFSIAHVVLVDDNMAKVTIYKNPARLCQLGNLKLAVMVQNSS